MAAVMVKGDARRHALETIDWSEAACFGGLTDSFFPRAGESITGELLERARQICTTCPLVQPCQSYGQMFEDHGIWGGRVVDASINNQLHGHLPWFRVPAGQSRECSVCHALIEPGQAYRYDKHRERDFCGRCST